MAALSGCGSDSSVAVTPADAARTLSGKVYLDSARAGTIRLLDAGGQELSRASVDATGTFFLTPHPNGAKLVADLASGESVERTLAQGGYAWLNVPSHLTSLYASAHPDLSAQQAEAAVLAGLSIPTGTGTHGISSFAGSPFSHVRFLDEARRGGGFEQFSRQVADRIGRGEKLSFAGPERSSARRLVFREGPREEIRAAGAVGSVFGFIGSQVGGDIITLGTNDLLGMISSALGLNLGTSNKLNAISQQLNQVLDELNALQASLTLGNTTQSYRTNQTAMNSTLRGIQNITVSVAQSALQAGTANASSGSTFNHGPTVPVTGSAANRTAALQTLQESAGNISQYLVSAEPSANQITLYNQLALETLNLSGVVSSTESAETFNYPIRQDLWTVGAPNATVSLQANLDYYSNWVVQALVGLAEFGQASAVVPLPLNNTGVAPAGPLDQSRQAVIANQLSIMQAQQYVPAPLGYSCVFVDVPNGLMWYTACFGAGTLAQAQGDAEGLTVGPWGPAPAPSVDQGTYTSGYGPTGGWRLPTYAEYLTLWNRSSKTLYSSTPGIGLPALGFSVPSGSQTISTSHVYGKPMPIGGQNNYQYLGFEWTKGELGSSGTSSPGPNYTWFYVRRIPDYTSGDTPTLAHTAYGYLPDGLQFLGDFNSSTGQFSQQNGQLELAGNVNGQGSHSNLSQRAVWTLGNPQTASITPLGSEVQVNWHATGNATLTASVQGYVPGQTGLQTRSISQSFISPLTGPDAFTSIQITPYQVAYAAPPNANDSMLYFLTGFTQGGRAVNLTGVTWTAQTSSQVAAFSNPAVPNSLVYGPQAGSVNGFTVQASYAGKTYTATVAY